MQSLSCHQSTSSLIWWAERAVGLIAMALAIVSGSAIGPVFKYMENRKVPPCLAASWRSQTMLIFLVPPTLVEIYATPRNERIRWVSRCSGLRFSPAIHMIVSGIAWTANLLCWIEGLEFTTTVRASVFANVHPLMLVILLRVTGTLVSGMEWLGVGIVMLGILISACREEFERFDVGPTDTVNRRAWIGDLLCLVAAFGEMIVLVDRIKTKAHIPIMQYTMTTTIVVTLASIFLSLIFESSPDGSIAIFCKGEYCVLGWTNEAWVMPMLLFGLFVGVICMCGYNYSVQIISPLIFSSLTLLEPAVTGLLSWLVRVEGVPDAATMLGGIVVIIGVWLISVGESTREHPSAEGVRADIHVELPYLEVGYRTSVRRNSDSDDDSGRTSRSLRTYLSASRRKLKSGFLYNKLGTDGGIDEDNFEFESKDCMEVVESPMISCEQI